MRKQKYEVVLRVQEREGLAELVDKGQAPAYRIKHANILLKVDRNGPGWSDKEAADAFGCNLNTVCNVRRRFVERGLECAVVRKPQEAPSHKPVLDGEKEAHLIAMACGTPPEGRARWTLKLLADKLVELEVVEAISDQTVRRTLKKTRCARIGVSAGAFPRSRMASL
jgi:transposase